jgi:response regulator NasT
MPDLDGLEAAARLCATVPLPVILVSAYHDPELIRRAEASHVMAYLIKPIKQADLEPAITLAVRRFEQLEQLRQEAADLRQALEDRKLVERAKGAIMKRAGLNEPDAFRRLQKTASDRNLKLVEAARMILAAEEAFQGP